MFFAPTKDPEATLDYSVDWAPWLDEGDAVAAHVVTVEAGITLVSSALDGAVVALRLSGGEVGRVYGVTVEITTTSGQVDQRTVSVQVGER